jgi:hypothetical protein
MQMKGICEDFAGMPLGVLSNLVLVFKIGRIKK